MNGFAGSNSLVVAAGKGFDSIQLNSSSLLTLWLQVVVMTPSR